MSQVHSIAREALAKYLAGWLGQGDPVLVAEECLHRIKEQNIVLVEYKPSDWRVGLSCKPVHRSHQMYYETCHVVDVFPSGTAGKVDKDGILMIKAMTGRVFLEESSLWRTA